MANEASRGSASSTIGVPRSPPRPKETRRARRGRRAGGPGRRSAEELCRGGAEGDHSAPTPSGEISGGFLGYLEGNSSCAQLYAPPSIRQVRTLETPITGRSQRHWVTRISGFAIESEPQCPNQRLLASQGGPVCLGISEPAESTRPLDHSACCVPAPSVRAYAG